MLTADVHAFIAAPREDIYDALADLSLRVAWCDHFMKDLRLATPAARGRGAAARYLLGAPLNRLWIETQIVEAERPRLVVEAIHGGRNGRSRGEVTWELSREGSGLTRVEMSTILELGTPRERLKVRLGTQRWLRRQGRTALDRLRLIFEEGDGQPLARATVAGYEPLKAPRFGASPRVVRG